MFDQIDMLTLVYGFFNTLRLASYFPQIVAVARDRQGAAAISVLCWSIWIGANGTTALYAWMKLNDVPLASLNAFNTLCCAAVVVIALFKRATYQATRAAPVIAR